MKTHDFAYGTCKGCGVTQGENIGELCPLGFNEIVADFDAQRRDLQARNTELVEERRALAVKLDEITARLVYTEAIVAALQPATFMDGYFLARLWVLAQDKPIRDRFQELTVHVGA